MKRIYVAGAYSDPHVINVFRNMGKGIRVCRELLLDGYVPFCPWLDYHLVMDGQVTIEMIKAYSMEWLKVSEAVVLVYGWENSEGTKAELREAIRLGLPIFAYLEAFREKRPIELTDDFLRKIEAK